LTLSTAAPRALALVQLKMEAEGTMSERIVFVNGNFASESQAVVSVFDHGLLYGDGIFDTAVAWNGRLFKFEQHLDRFFRGLTYVKLESPYTRAELKELILETVRRNELETAYVKWVVTRGTTEQPLLDITGAVPSCFIFAQPYLHLHDPKHVRAGVRLKTTSGRRVPAEAIDPRIKSLNFLNLVLARIEATSAGCDNALLLDMNGHVCEGAGFNLFTVQGQLLRTPARGILEGITRGSVLEIAESHDIPVDRGTLELFDLYTADEILITSTAGGIMPVVEVDGRSIGRGEPGPMFERISEAYRALLAADGGTAIYPRGGRARADLVAAPAD